ncbi:hypothetical protein [Chitinophaga rhizophila]|uniref:Uncharacterized protein n=1 Tax=Chitinophaga rhizophila TaxID=2866212 RepID=A0ABS7GML2_9BACT|nr:hypothetical protein [Chitinophaga rhizophila]MBW8688214.1 hypothetical protein [Chitinophaga rhizophila]
MAGIRLPAVVRGLTDTADGNFIPELVKVLRQTVLEQVEKMVSEMELA